jgi:hypothetical protein
MKKRFVAFALLISAVVVSVSSGCMVRGEYGRGYHNDRYHHGYHDDRGGHQGGYGHY